MSISVIDVVAKNESFFKKNASEFKLELGIKS